MNSDENPYKAPQVDEGSSIPQGVRERSPLLWLVLVLILLALLVLAYATLFPQVYSTPPWISES
jgi:hypothetical protein